jgi:hypothetical protein
MLILTQDRYTICGESTIGSEMIFDAPNETRDVGHLEFCFGPFGEGVSFSARLVHVLHQMYHRLKNYFGRTRWYS